MPTKKPRIAITLPQPTFDILNSISKTSGRPMSAFVADLLEGAKPTLERMAVTFQKIKQAQDVERSTFLDSVSDAQAAIEPVVMEAIGQFDLFMDKIDAAVEERARHPEGMAAGPISAAVFTPSTNRGVTNPKPKQLQPSTGKALKGVSKREVSNQKPRSPRTSQQHKKGVTV